MVKLKPETVALQYCDDILTGQIPACKWTKLAVQRHLGDLQRAKRERNYPFYFDQAAADHVIEFFHNYLFHFEGEWAGQPFILEPFQQFIKSAIFGWKLKSDGTRRFRKAYISMARKNGKSLSASGDGLYLFDADGEPGAQVMNAATKLKQARIIHGAAIKMVQASPTLSKRIGIVRDNLHVIETASKFEPLGRDSKTEDGWNIHGALVDEYHAHPTAGMLNVLRTGMRSRRQPLMIIVTTAGFEKQFPCYSEEEELIRRILEGIIEDDSTFGIIYTLDEEEREGDKIVWPADDWRDPKVWIKANPNLGVSVKLRDMEDMCREAIESPTKQNEFKTKSLNIWTEAEHIWITSHSWNACADLVNEEALAGRICYGGLDLSTSQDITAVGYAFPPVEEGEKFKLLWRFYMPELCMAEREKKDKVPYRLWADRGYIRPTPGAVIDYDFIEADIQADSEKFQLKSMLFDPHNSNQIVLHLMAKGIEVVECQQYFSTLSPMTKDFEKKVLKEELAHGGNPVMRWMISCTTVAQNAAGDVKPVKPDRGKSTKRIDGVIAGIMALAGACGAQEEESAYEQHGVRTI